MDNSMRHLFIEIEKKGENYDATLSDDSIDRDNEFFSPELIKAWGTDNSTIPFLVDHVNSMMNLIGGWTNRHVVEQGGHTALKMQPKFFTEKANPLATQIQAQIDEATAMGLQVGLSIGFIPKKGMMVSDKYMHIDAELVEGTAVPVQSNRHAGISLAKAFTIKQNDSFKKTSAVKQAGDIVETPIPSIDEKKIADEKALKEKAEIDAMKKEYEDAKIKLAAYEKNEKKIAEELETAKKALEEANKKASEPHGKIPAAMLNNSGIAKEPPKEQETFNASKAYLKLHGVEVE